jgi:hypothetical protein
MNRRPLALERGHEADRFRDRLKASCASPDPGHEGGLLAPGAYRLLSSVEQGPAAGDDAR